MNAIVQRTGVLAACFVAGIIAVCWRMEIRAAGARDPKAMANHLDQPETKIASSWDQQAAAAYLDQRAAWWMEWPKAARDHETFCVSCHTAVPYALSRLLFVNRSPRQLLRRTNAGSWTMSPSVYVFGRKSHRSTATRIAACTDVESRGTESVLNALMLASNDAQGGQLSNDTRTALDNMWAEQQTTGNKKGAWLWLRFANEPWEADDSDYYGATLAAVAAGTSRGITTRDLKSKITSRCCANT